MRNSAVSHVDPRFPTVQVQSVEHRKCVWHSVATAMEKPQSSPTCRDGCTYVAVVVIVLLLGREFGCTCKPQASDCTLYLTLPAFIIFVFVLWADGRLQRLCRHVCSSSGRGLLARVARRVVRAAFVSLLWVVYVLLDGRWYICCMSDRSAQQAQLACRSEGSASEQDRVLLAEMKNRSRLIGTSLLFGIVGVPALLATLEWRKPSSRAREALYHQLILEQEEDVLKEILRQSAREKLTEEMKGKIREQRWEQCFDVAQQLIEASAVPTRPGRTQEQD